MDGILQALYNGNGDLAQQLAKRAGDDIGFPEACAVGDEARVRAMLDRDAALIDKRSADGFTPLALSIFFRQPHVARLLIERGANVNAAAENPMRVAPLHAAVAVADSDSLRLLLAAGADPNARQQNEYTPLHGAASRGDVASGELLLRKGADPYALSGDGKSAAHIARERGHGEFAEWLESVTT